MQNYRHYKNRDYVYYKQNDSDEKCSIGRLLDFNEEFFLIHTDIHVHNKEITLFVHPSNVAPILLDVDMLNALKFKPSNVHGSRFVNDWDGVVISATGHGDNSTKLCLVDFAQDEEMVKFNANYHRYFGQGQVNYDLLYDDYKYVGDINRFHEALGHNPLKTLEFLSIYFKID